MHTTYINQDKHTLSPTAIALILKASETLKARSTVNTDNRVRKSVENLYKGSFKSLTATRIKSFQDLVELSLSPKLLTQSLVEIGTDAIDAFMLLGYTMDAVGEFNTQKRSSEVSVKVSDVVAVMRSMDTITTGSVIKELAVGRSKAQRILNACKACVLHLDCEVV